MLKQNILIVEDDTALCELLVWNFKNEGFDVRSTGNGAEAMIMASEQIPDVVLLDWMIDELPGIEVCRHLRRREDTANVPVLMITARTSEEDRLRGLEMGADDYILKPFSARELIARVTAIMRRTRPLATGKTVRFADLELDPVEHRARRGGRALRLGPKEFRLLAHFMERPRRVYTREQLLNAVWGMNSQVGARTVDVHIRRLRRTLNLPGEADLIRTIRATGYALDLS